MPGFGIIYDLGDLGLECALTIKFGRDSRKYHLRKYRNTINSICNVLAKNYIN